MTDSQLKRGARFSTIILLTILLIILYKTPGGMILPALCIGGIYIIGIAFAAFILAGLLRIIFNKYSYESHLLVSLSLGFLIFITYLLIWHLHH